MTEVTPLHAVEPGRDSNISRPTIALFWSRLLALFVDALILGTLGLLIGFFFFDALARLGGWGRAIGFTIAFFYFGLLNSTVGGGQTIGKRFSRVRVVHREGTPISPWRSFLRFSVIGLPFFLNGAMIRPEIATSLAGKLMAIFIFGIGGAIIYLYVFNRRSRQSLHDLVAGTYVVSDRGAGEVEAPKIWNLHLAVAGLWLAAVIVLVALVIPWWTSQSPFAELLSLQKKITGMQRVQAASVSLGEIRNAPSSSTPAAKTTYVLANVFWKEGTNSFETAATEVAAIILKEYPAVYGRDLLIVKINYGYDIGISHLAKSYSISEPAREWVEKTAPPR